MPDIHNFVRAYTGPAQLRAAADGEKIAEIRFAVFDQWTEIRSPLEGHFLERIAPGAFKRTFTERARPLRVMYDHGQHPQVGTSPIGKIKTLEETRSHATSDVALLDAPYVRDWVEPPLRAGELGASFRFSPVEGGTHEETPMKATSWNPDRLPEVTRTDLTMHEFGPTPLGQYGGATAQMRSLTDDWYDALMHDPRFLLRLAELLGIPLLDKMLTELPADGLSEAADEILAPDAGRSEENVKEEQQTDETADGVETADRAHRLAWLARATAGFDAHIDRLERTSQ